MARNAKCESFVGMVFGHAWQAAGEQARASWVCQSYKLALLLSARLMVSPAAFLTFQKMVRNTKCAFFVAMALGCTRQAAGETLTGKSGLPELAPLLSAQSTVGPVASLRHSSVSYDAVTRRQCDCVFVHVCVYTCIQYVLQSTTASVTNRNWIIEFALKVGFF